jgi:hypothetical protein
LPIKCLHLPMFMQFVKWSNTYTYPSNTYTCPCQIPTLAHQIPTFAHQIPILANQIPTLAHVKYLHLPIKYLHFPIKYLYLPIKYLHLPISNTYTCPCQIPTLAHQIPTRAHIKYLHLPIKYLHLPIKYLHLPMFIQFVKWSNTYTCPCLWNKFYLLGLLCTCQCTIYKFWGKLRYRPLLRMPWRCVGGRKCYVYLIWVVEYVKPKTYLFYHKINKYQAGLCLLYVMNDDK